MSAEEIGLFDNMVELKPDLEELARIEIDAERNLKKIMKDQKQLVANAESAEALAVNDAKNRYDKARGELLAGLGDSESKETKSYILERKPYDPSNKNNWQVELKHTNAEILDQYAGREDEIEQWLKTVPATAKINESLIKQVVAETGEVPEFADVKLKPEEVKVKVKK